MISQIFTGFTHAFAISNLGDVFGWGNFNLNRLTSDYGEKQSKNPKVINIQEDKDKEIEKDKDKDKENKDKDDEDKEDKDKKDKDKEDKDNKDKDEENKDEEDKENNNDQNEGKEKEIKNTDVNDKENENFLAKKEIRIEENKLVTFILSNKPIQSFNAILVDLLF